MSPPQWPSPSLCQDSAVVYRTLTPPGRPGSICRFAPLSSISYGICVSLFPPGGTQAGPSLGLWLHHPTDYRLHIAGLCLCCEPAQPFHSSFRRSKASTL